ncbi:restriction endonuclease subunit S [uncultured Flavobacterium sp.]|uniref:restriction endonuclease subunit S n=1 Tax=uncultured Flavobacterium sp. TaxID=165435 RepID=UPI0030EBF2FE|tara:strand:- start:165 stop:1388 length:1224 start_codon:yes stop_codon:yes gene_type:complete
MIFNSKFIFKKISEGSSFLSGYAFKSSDFTSHGIPVIKIKNIQDKRVNFLKDQFVSEKKLTEKLEKFKIRKNDILIAMTGQGSVGRVGQVKIKTNTFGLLNQRVGKFICDEIKLNNNYLFYVISSQRYEEYLFNKAIGSGQPNLSPSDIINIKIPFPSYEEQKSIAQILSTIDDKIENNLAINKTLEEMAMALYKHWFVDFGPFQNGEFVDSELGSIPKGWEVKRLDEIYISHNKKRKPISTNERAKIQGEYPYFGATKILDYIDHFKFEGEYILLAEDGTVKTERDTPFLQFVTGKFCVSNHAHVLTGNKDYSNEFLYLSLSNTNVIPIITGAVQLKINKENLEKLQFIVSPKETLNRFEDKIIPLYKQIKENELENQTLTQLRDTLLPKLISGEVRLKEYRELTN